MPRPLDETPRWCPSTTLASCAAARGTTSNPRLVARVFGAANPPLRVRLLSCLIQPLGTLGIAGVAAGAFAVFVGRDGPSATRIDFGRRNTSAVGPYCSSSPPSSTAV